MADILPYLGVAQAFPEDDPAGKTVILEDMTGMTAEQVEKLLKEQGLTAQMLGDDETVTGQIPAAGMGVPGNSEILLYFGDTPAQRMATVPDFTGMNRLQASDTAGAAGLYVLVTGNTSLQTHVVVTAQSEPKDTQVPVGSTIRLEFTDTQASD